MDLIIWITLDLIFLFIFIAWCVNTIRNIAKKPEGYLKFGQIIFLILSWLVFIVILIYSILISSDNPKIDIFLTVIVGFLGTMIGMFFSESNMRSLREKLNEKNKSLYDIIESLERKKSKK